MKNSFRRNFRFGLGLLALIVGISLICTVGNNGFFRLGITEAKMATEPIVPEQGTVALDKDHPLIRSAIAVQYRHTPRLLAIPHVVGTAVGLNENGSPAILVLAKDIVGRGVIPEDIEGMPVQVKLTGEILALQTCPPPTNLKNPRAKFTPPVPIGVSTGNVTAPLCDTGTISARLTDGKNVYALSNNHVYALENANNIIGTSVLQPGLVDAGCPSLNNGSPGNSIGTVYAYVPINFAGGNNTVDAAIAFSNTGQLCNSTPSNGYGVPSSTTVSAGIYQSVQKYGRTTSLTKGTIYGINATVTVNYGSSGNATFVNQIIVFSFFRPFIQAGDSGSLLVTNNPSANPVGLVFAGNSSGTYAIANPINQVLTSLGNTTRGAVIGTPVPNLKIDGK